MIVNNVIKKINWVRIWYMLCFLVLGIIDQRRGSALGEVQMAAANITGIVMAVMLVPSVDVKRCKDKIYKYWSMVSFLGGIIAGVWGWYNWNYKGQWITGVLNIVIWGYFAIYIIKERKSLCVLGKVKRPFFIVSGVMFMLMFFSAYEGIASLWLWGILGGFYLIGVKDKNREDFFQGMLDGIILWFFIQQIIAFGFRPYDYVRYKGLYSGETQNGLFYMIVYCAFLAKWLWQWERGKSKLMAFFSFGLAAGCLSFTLYTGGRSPIMGIVMSSIVAYLWYDIAHRKSFYKLLRHGILLIICVAITFPIVYGCIRYLPAIMHHPIWFEGEYSEEDSVRSFDPWNSERYITFERALNMSLGRILSMAGVDLKEWKEKNTSDNRGITAYAKEVDEPGSTPENPFTLPEVDLNSAMGARKVIYTYFWNHLNWIGHSKEEGGFYLSKTTYMSHAHNMFLQIAYDYGIPAGLLFIGLYFSGLIHAFQVGRYNLLKAMTCVVFLVAILGYGFFEMAVVPGQITVVLMGILFCLIEEERLILQKK